MEYLLNEGHRPHSVYEFTTRLNIKEKEFYNHFGSFEAIDERIFQLFFENAITVLNKDKEYGNYQAKDKLVSFYFTFFEVLTANRSYVVKVLHEERNKLESLKKLRLLHDSFINYVSALKIESPDLKQETLERIKNRGMEELAWSQLLLTLKFWMNDSSPAFEKTDIFIEKSINTAFQLFKIEPIESIIDLGKFLLKETWRPRK